MWDRRTEDRLNVLPMLELISKTLNSKFSHLSCNTREELTYNLQLLRKRNYGILYFAFHGSPGKIHLHRDRVSLTELGEMMRQRFAGWIIHFGTCSTLRKPREVERFVETTGASLVTGFTRDVDWIESSAFELLLFKAFQTYKSPKIVVRHLMTKYSQLAELAGFEYFPAFD
jgi:hypothetical protein